MVAQEVAQELGLRTPSLTTLRMNELVKPGVEAGRNFVCLILLPFLYVVLLVKHGGQNHRCASLGVL